MRYYFRQSRSFTAAAVALGALTLSTLGINATDALNGRSGSLLGSLFLNDTPPAVCPADMVYLTTGQSFTCVDRYEASPTESCPHPEVRSIVATQENLNERGCAVVAEAGKLPWTAVTREQARTLCARSGKRLPTAAEWYITAIGTPDALDQCNLTSGDLKLAGSNPACLSAAGVSDLVGNTWEWVSDDVRDGRLGEYKLPASGYVAQVDQAGVGTVATDSPDDLFGQDYLWSEPQGSFGLLRGGYYGSQSDGGLFALQAKTPPTTATPAIGFRCVR